MNLLEKIELALNDCKNNKETETQVTLTFAELRLIRRYELVDNYNNSLASENLRAGLELNKNYKRMHPLNEHHKSLNSD